MPGSAWTQMVSGHCGPSRTSKGKREGGDWSWPPHQPPISSGRCYAFQILSSSSADSSDPAGYARIICDDVVTVNVTRGQAPSGTGRHFKGDILRATFNGSPVAPPLVLRATFNGFSCRASKWSRGESQWPCACRGRSDAVWAEGVSAACESSGCSGSKPRP